MSIAAMSNTACMLYLSATKPAISGATTHPKFRNVKMIPSFFAISSILDLFFIIIPKADILREYNETIIIATIINIGKDLFMDKIRYEIATKNKESENKFALSVFSKIGTKTKYDMIDTNVRKLDINPVIALLCVKLLMYKAQIVATAAVAKDATKLMPAKALISFPNNLLFF